MGEGTEPQRCTALHGQEPGQRARGFLGKDMVLRLQRERKAMHSWDIPPGVAVERISLCLRPK